MELFLQRIIDGLTNGAIYSVVAIALVLIFKATTLINFAQGELAMLGTFFVYVLAAEQGLNVGWRSPSRWCSAQCWQPASKGC